VSSTGNIQPLSISIIRSARSCGASLLAVSCPLCKYNLESSQLQNGKGPPPGEFLPVVYFTQLLGLALGLHPEELELDPRQMQAIREAPTPMVQG
jgi:heterodisulfide reductase subunit B